MEARPLTPIRSAVSRFGIAAGGSASLAHHQIAAQSEGADEDGLNVLWHDLSSRGAQTWSEECRGSMKSAPSLRTPAVCSLPCNKGPSVAPPSPHRLSPTCTAPSPRRLRSGGDSAAAREKGAAIGLSPSPPRRTAAELGRGRCPIALPQPAERCKADETALLQRKVVSV